MASSNERGAALRRVRAAFDVGAVRELTDGQLLERFATDRGEAAELAFSALVERHGPMVLRVARGVLGDAHEAQDAFQATFLVLVRRARGLWVRDSLGPWLHQVARRTASCARLGAARRRHHERQAAGAPREVRPEPADDLAGLLHEEVDRLPGRYRAAVVLCDLEGRTHEQAARHLGWPVGTVKSRLSRGRDRLRDRLIRRGLAPTSGVLVASSLADASLPSSLVDAAVRAASRALAAPGLAAGPAAILAREVLRSMTILYWSKLAASAVLAGATASGVGLVAGTGQAPGPQADRAPVAEARIAAGGDRIETPGTVEPSRSRGVLSQVRDGTKIVMILPEGTRVKAGDVVCELDSASLRDRLVNQRVAAQQAEAAYKQALLVREVAEYAVKEYTEGIFKQDEATAQGAIEESRSALGRAENRLERTRRARDRIVATAVERPTAADFLARLELEDRLEDAEVAVAREKKALAAATSRAEVLLTSTREKQIKSLTGDVEKARVDEVSKREAWEREKAGAGRIERQIEACILRAPGDGIVAYARDLDPAAPRIQVGAFVNLYQLLFRVPDLEGPMRVKVQVPEVAVDRVELGTKARVKVDALPGKELDGIVVEVAPRLDPETYARTKRKMYTVLIRIDDPQAGVRPGMTATAEFPLGPPQ